MNNGQQDGMLTSMQRFEEVLQFCSHILISLGMTQGSIVCQHSFFLGFAKLLGFSEVPVSRHRNLQTLALRAIHQSSGCFGEMPTLLRWISQSQGS